VEYSGSTRITEFRTTIPHKDLLDAVAVAKRERDEAAVKYCETETPIWNRNMAWSWYEESRDNLAAAQAALDAAKGVSK
jgi:hypothetical protein